MEFSRQQYWSGLPFPSPGNLPNPGIEAGSPALQADALPAELPRKPILESKTSSNYGVVMSRILTCNDAPNLASHEMEWPWTLPGRKKVQIFKCQDDYDNWYSFLPQIPIERGQGKMNWPHNVIHFHRPKKKKKKLGQRSFTFLLSWNVKRERHLKGVGKGGE